MTMAMVIEMNDRKMCSSMRFHTIGQRSRKTSRVSSISSLIANTSLTRVPVLLHELIDYVFN